MNFHWDKSERHKLKGAASEKLSDNMFKYSPRRALKDKTHHSLVNVMFYMQQTFRCDFG